MQRDIYGVNHVHSGTPRLPMSPPLCSEVRTRMDEAIDVLDTIESAKLRAQTFIVAAEVDSGANLEGCLGFKGEINDVASLLAELIMRFTEDEQRGAALYKYLRTLQHQKAAKKIQADLDAA